MTNPKHTDISRSGDLVERLRALHVWPQAVADDHADLLTPRQIDKLYEVGRVSHEAADRIEALEAEVERLRDDSWFDQFEEQEQLRDNAEQRLSVVEAEIKPLREAATALRDDMVNRAKMNAWQNDGEIVVEAGAGVWARFCAALGEKQ